MRKMALKHPRAILREFPREFPHGRFPRELPHGISFAPVPHPTLDAMIDRVPEFSFGANVHFFNLYKLYMWSH